MSDSSKDPVGTVRRAQTGFAHAICLDQFGSALRWQIIDVYGPMDLVTNDAVEDWPVVYTPLVDELWKNIEWSNRSGCECETILVKDGRGGVLNTFARQCLDHFLD